jgi:hypothetical protein
MEFPRRIDGPDRVNLFFAFWALRRRERERTRMADQGEPLAVVIGEAAHYVTTHGWIVVGHTMRLVVGDDQTVMVAVVARDSRGHFLAVSPIDVAGRYGMGIIDLSTAEAYFAPVAAPTGRPN